MSAVATFDDVFGRACRAKIGTRPVTDLAFADSGAGAFALVRCGSRSDAFLLTAKGVQFIAVDGRKVDYSWEQLDFVLPGDLSLAADKLRTTTDIDTPSKRIARAAGRYCAYAAVAWLVYFVVTTVFGFLWGGYWTLHGALWYFGDVLFIAALVTAVGALAPFATPIAIGAFATGGIVGGLGLWLGRLVATPVRFALKTVGGDFPNSIIILDAQWVKMPWGTTTTELLDFVIVGIKLRRRGLT